MAEGFRADDPHLRCGGRGGEPHAVPPPDGAEEMPSIVEPVAQDGHPIGGEVEQFHGRSSGRRL